MKMSMQISVGGGRYVTQYDVRQRKESHQKKKGKREKQGMPSCQVVLPRSTVQGSTAQAASKISQLTQLDLTQFNSTQLNSRLSRMLSRGATCNLQLNSRRYL